MPDRPPTPTLLCRLRAIRLHVAVAGLAALAALTGPLADTVARAGNTTAPRVSPQRAGRTASACPWLDRSLPIASG